MHAAGDIGCYTLGAVAPLSVIDTTMMYGIKHFDASWNGESKRKRIHKKIWVAVIGDSTFFAYRHQFIDEYGI